MGNQAIAVQRIIVTCPRTEILFREEASKVFVAAHPDMERVALVAGGLFEADELTTLSRAIECRAARAVREFFPKYRSFSGSCSEKMRDALLAWAGQPFMSVEAGGLGHIMAVRLHEDPPQNFARGAHRLTVYDMRTKSRA